MVVRRYAAAPTKTVEPVVLPPVVLPPVEDDSPFGKRSPFGVASPFGKATAFGAARTDDGGPFGRSPFGAQSGSAEAQQEDSLFGEQGRARRRRPRRIIRQRKVYLAMPPPLPAPTGVFERPFGVWGFHHRPILDDQEQCDGDEVYLTGDAIDFPWRAATRHENQVANGDFQSVYYNGPECECDPEEGETWNCPALEPVEAFWKGTGDPAWDVDDLDRLRPDINPEAATLWDQAWPLMKAVRETVKANPAAAVRLVPEKERRYLLIEVAHNIGWATGRLRTEDLARKMVEQCGLAPDSQLVVALADAIAVKPEWCEEFDPQLARILSEMYEDLDLQAIHPDELACFVVDPDDRPEDVGRRGPDYVIEMNQHCVIAQTAYYSCFEIEPDSPDGYWPTGLYAWKECLVTPTGRQQFGQAYPANPKWLKVMLAE